MEAQELYGVTPDLTTMGKIIGGGLPLAAYGGRADIMNKIAPAGRVYQAGTLSGNPVAVSAGIAILKYLEAHPEVYDALEKSSAAMAAHVPAGVCVNRVGSMLTFFWQAGPVRNYEDAKKSNTAVFSKFFHHLLERGVYFPPSQFEAVFVSAAHTPQDIEYTTKVIGEFAAAA